MHIVVPYDGSEQSRKALDHTLEQYEDATITLLHVLDFVEAGYDAPPEAALPGYWSEWYEEAEDRAQELLEEAEAEAGRELETETVVGRPARAIIEYVEENEVDAVVMGSHGREGISRVLLGSVAETILRRSPVPVTIVR